jgi:arogenate dehydrogenase (NADP+)
VEVVEKIARSLQATIYHCPPEEHDRAVSWISHLPVMVSAALIAACMSEPNPDVLVLAQQLASSGFRDTSRVGGGNPELGVMMARYNRQELLRSLQQYQHHLEVLIDLVEQENWIALKQQLESNHLARPHFIDEYLL